MNTLTIVIHGESGSGKTVLADTAPAPRLVLDAEGGSQFAPSQPKVTWNPAMYAPPGTEGCDPAQQEVPPTTRVLVRDFDTLSRVYQWLNAGHHRFRSVVIDSLTEVQKRCLDAVVGTNTPATQDWGTLLAKMESLVRSMRDLTMHPSNPVQCVVITCLTVLKDGTRRPFVKGQLQDTLPGFVDVMGYLYTEVDQTSNALMRRLLVQPYPGFAAKDRTGRLGAVVEVPIIVENGEAVPGAEPAIEVMMRTVFKGE